MAHTLLCWPPRAVTAATEGSDRHGLGPQELSTNTKGSTGPGAGVTEADRVAWQGKQAVSAEAPGHSMRLTPCGQKGGKSMARDSATVAGAGHEVQVCGRGRH